MIGPQLPNKLKRARISDENDMEPPLKRAKVNESNESKEENELMHPRNIYRDGKPNYYELSQKYSFFADVLQQNSKTGDYFIDFKDPMSNVMLTKVLLKNDFDLDFEHPLDRLCPAITQRLNYLLWIQDLIQCIKPKRDKFHGFDIGVGASCIFPLLGIKIGEQQNEKWTFIASDIDQKSVQFSNKNVIKNKMEQKIKIIHQKNRMHIFRGIISENTDENDILFDFTVCNPPFFEHLEECGHNKARSNNATSSELVFAGGGEIGFIQLMIEEIDDLRLHQRINWFSSILGKKSSIKILKAMLNKKGALVVTTEFFQGRQVRWGLAWSYNEDIKREYDALFGSSYSMKNEFLFTLMTPCNASDYNECLLQKIRSLFKRYGINYDEESMDRESKKQWIRIDDEESNGFVFSLKWIINANDCKKENELSVLVSFKWHKGDKQLFDGFIKWFHSKCCVNCY